ncbi:MBL fold metallo-hydrolase [bacterium]|nr:MBL fold metallo-hydrolase [bacterium]
MKIKFFGAVGGVTGSCYQVICGNKSFLIDCGMFQGCKAQKEFNYKEFSFKPEEVDFVVVTHAHIDHTGLLPKLVKKGFKGLVYASEPTAEVLKFLLPDSAKIQENEVAQKNKRNERKGAEPITPIYTIADAQEAISRLRPVKPGSTLNPIEGVSIKLFNAGHVLGSCFLEISLREGNLSKKVIFSGDLGGIGHPIVKDPDTFSEADVLLIESTYGNRLHDEIESETRINQISKILIETVKKGGNLIIPSFAFERTQDLMHDLMILMDKKAIPEVEIFIDSPLAVHSTEVFTKFPQFYDEEATALLKKHGSLFNNKRFQCCLTTNDSKLLNEKKGVVILSASGMCDAGRIKHHLKNNLWRKEATILFVGFQALGTLGRLLLEGEKKVKIHGEEVKVEARIEKISGYSGHADQAELLNWLSHVKTVKDKVFVVHGEDDARETLAKLLQEKRKFNLSIPKFGETYDFGTAKHDEETAIPLPSIDSFNLYAQVTLKLADFMRKQPDEKKRKILIEKILQQLP